MQQGTFQRQRIGVFPLLGIRDWTVFLSILVLIVSGLIAFSQWAKFDTNATWGGLIGGLLGIMPSVFICLPVHGTMPRSRKHHFLAAIFDMGFNLESKQQNQSIYVHKSPRWMRWDSNRVTLDEKEEGDIQASIPLYVFKALKMKGKI